MKYKIYTYIAISVLGGSMISAEEVKDTQSTKLNEVSNSSAGTYRTWTDKSTNRTLRAKIIGTDKENGTVSLQLVNLKKVNLEIERLVAKDQEIIQKWVAPVKKVHPVRARDQLTVYVIKSGQSTGKHVEIKVIADSSDVILKGKDRYHRTIRKTVKAGNTEKFRFPVLDRYEFTLHDEEGKLLDKESATRKTGTTDK